ncbi:MAG: hypothetical protein VB021_01935 [Oscillospiraceae bacterium]|nr:hypothetical protein [Oscillospiraceae bacterium]
MEDKQGLSISKKTFFSTAAILLAILLFAGILTQILPRGAYDRVVTAQGYTQVVDGTYRETGEAKLPVWRWFTAPFEVFASGDSAVAIVIMVFLVFMGGAFLVLDKSGVLRRIMFVLASRFGKTKYRLLAVSVLVCMAMGSFVGMMEETVPLVPIGVALALALGWDTFVGVGMTLLAVGMGFAAGTVNVFTIGIAQNLAGLPTFSGIGWRLVYFAVVYGIFLFFLTRYAKKIEADPKRSALYESDKERRARFAYNPDDPVALDARVAKGTRIFVCSLLPVVVYVLLSLWFTALSDYVLPVLMVLMTFGALTAGAVSGYSGERGGLLRDFGSGMLSILPCSLFIILAMSAKQILVEGGIMDTILYRVYGLLSGLGPYTCVLLIYVFVLILEFFVSSASAKAFLMMPLLVPLADLVGITRQTLVQAYAFGDGFTNLFYPTNSMLLIALGIINVSYAKWFRWTWKLQAVLAAVSCAFLLFFVKIGWGPF